MPDVIANKLDHLLILTSGTEQYLLTCTNKKYKFLLTTTLTISAIDNSASERAIRTFCIGKKNWMFHNTANGAWASALIYSISETVKLNGLRPYYYFRYILTELPKLCDEQGNLDPADLDHLMPWATDLPEECRKPRR